VSRVWVEVSPGRQRLVEVDTPATGGSNAPFIRREHLSPKARRALRIQLGRDFDSESSLRAYLKQNDMRLIDKGEKVDKDRKTREAWLKDTKPGQRKGGPHVGSHGYNHWAWLLALGLGPFLV
jgi:hypothetical protein